MKQIFIVLLFITLFSSCRKDKIADSDKIFTQYVLKYNASENISYAQTTFIYNTFYYKLEDDASIQFNNEALLFTEPGNFYEKKYDGFINEGIFIWHSSDKKKFTNKINLYSIDIPTMDTIQTNKNIKISWIGDSLRKNEKVVLYIDGKTNTDLKVFYQDSLYATSISFYIHSYELSGNCSIFIDRLYEAEPTNNTSEGGIVTGQYRSKSQSIFLK